jgi:hypothetical protein
MMSEASLALLPHLACVVAFATGAASCAVRQVFRDLYPSFIRDRVADGGALASLLDAMLHDKEGLPWAGAGEGASAWLNFATALRGTGLITTTPDGRAAVQWPRESYSYGDCGDTEWLKAVKQAQAREFAALRPNGTYSDADGVPSQRTWRTGTPVRSRAF